MVSRTTVLCGRHLHVMAAAVVLTLAVACSQRQETARNTDSATKASSKAPAAPGTVTPASLGLADDCDAPAFVLSMLSQNVAKTRPELLPGAVDTSDFPKKGCIREWNDKQRLYEQCHPDCADEYGPLAYVVADDAIDTWTKPADFVTAKRVAVIFSTEPYDDLHLRAESNSLYLKHDSKGWSAWMNDSTATLKAVQYDPVPPYTDSADFPGIARWDWNNNYKNQVIGVRCGNGWCEIGKNVKKEPSQFRGGKTRRIKAWYDSQRLAISIGGKLKPWKSTPATVFPIENLEALKDTSDFKEWVKVATIKSDTSYERLKIPLNKPDSSELSLKYDPQKGWRAQMSSRNIDGTSVLAEFDVTMMPHKEKIPGVARWGWEDDDESIWTRCANGCCQIKPTR